jgi:hypothetical protein
MKEEVTSYARMVEWLEEDLEEIRDEAAIEDARAFLESTHDLPNPPEWREPLRRAIEKCNRVAGANAKLQILNEALRRVFVTHTLTPEGYRETTQAMRRGEQTDSRLKARNPLPTLDVLALLADDPVHPSQCARAAALAAATIELHLAAGNDGISIAGSTIVPGDERDELAAADDDLRLLILTRGVAYTIPVTRPRDEKLCARLRHAFDWALCDAKGRNPSGVPALATAAMRPTCSKIRRELMSDPENATAFRRVEGCLFAVCLDETPRPDSMEELCRRLFGSYENRWYGMTAIAVNAAGDAGVLASYGRGLEAAPGLAFMDAMYRRSLALGVADDEVAILPAPEPVEFHETCSKELRERARAEISAAFHHAKCFFDVGIGSEFFSRHGLNPNATLNYLILLAAVNTFRPACPPALSHAVSRRGGEGSMGGVDWVVLTTNGVDAIRDAKDDAEWADRVAKAAARHFQKVKASRRGYSPTYFVRSPRTEADRMLYDFFVLIGSRYATGYRSYLFRATRGAGTMDILTSTLALPETVLYAGRAGACCEVAGMFGMHLSVEPAQTRLFLLPGPESAPKLAPFHDALDRLTVRLRRALEGDMPEAQSVAASEILTQWNLRTGTKSPGCCSNGRPATTPHCAS